MCTIIKCKFCNPAENIEVLKSYLPEEYEYVVCNFAQKTPNFKARLRTNGKVQEDANKWLEDFQLESKCTMRIDRTYPHSGTKNVFKVDLRCQHNTRPRSDKIREKESKNRDCPAKMSITVKRVVTERKSRSKDPHLPDYPTVIQIDFSHNHDIHTPEILKHRSVLPGVKEKILALFKLGHNPSTALDMHKYDLVLEHGENFEKICHDRALLPDTQYCYRLYYKILKKRGFPVKSENSDSDSACALSEKKATVPLSNCENSSILHSKEKDSYLTDMPSNGPEKKKKKRKLENTAISKNEMSEQLQEVLCKFCENGGLAGVQINDNNRVMALCTPLMYRVHTLIKQSGDIVFVDTYGDFEEPDSCRAFLFFTYSAIGAVPLGCIVTTSNTATCIKSALELWKQILPKNCFFNKSDGPDLFLTKDNEVERQCFKLAFPKSQMLICISHILQASWNFLLDRKNTIKKEHRSLFMSKIKTLLFSQSVEELEMNYAYTMADNLVKSYTVFYDYLKHIYNHRHDWSLVYRRHLLTRADDLSIFWESAMILQKDPLLSRSRSYNQLQIIDFIFRLDTFYERKLIDLANNRFDSVRFSRFLFIELPKDAYVIAQNSEIEYEVHNNTKDIIYQVDISLGVCECKIGKTGAPCKHQLLVFRNFTIPVYDCIPPSTSSERNLLLQLATGQKIESELTSEMIQKVPSIEPPAMPDSSNSGITIHDLEACGNGEFFLDENGACESLNQNPNQTLITHITTSVFTETVSTLTLPSSSLMPSDHIMDDHHESAIRDSILSSHNLLPHLDSSVTQNIQLNNALDSTLNEQMHSTNLHLPNNLQNSPPPPDPPSSTLPEPSANGVDSIIDQICSKLKERSSKSPAAFKPALGTFLKNLNDLSTDSSLEYALYSFGKFSKNASPFYKRKIVDNKLVGLQTTGKLRKKRLLRNACKNCHSVLMDNLTS